MNYLKNILLRCLLTLLPALILTACGHDDKIEIKGEIAGGRDITFRLVMYTPSGVRSDVLSSQSGRFEYSAPLPTDGLPVFIEFYTDDYVFLGAMSPGNDGKNSVTLNPDSPQGFKATGSAFNNTITEILSADNPLDNTEIENFITQNPDSPVGAMLLFNFYDATANPDGAAQLLSTLTDAGHPAYYVTGFEHIAKTLAAQKPDTIEPLRVMTNADSMATLRPADHRATLITFSDDEGALRTDSVIPLLRSLTAKSRAGNGLLVDHSLVADTLTWKRSLRSDTCTWLSVWSGAGTMADGASRFGITRLPYYVVADSAAHIVYTGTSADKADKTFRNLLKTQ